MELKLEPAQILKLEPGDVVVLKLDMRITAERHTYLLGALKSAFPEGTKCLLLEPGMELTAIRPPKR